MPKCPKCQKEVYFAERVTSLGKDWHRPCLKCEKCNKTLSPGSHAEVRNLNHMTPTVYPESFDLHTQGFIKSETNIESAATF
uniref:Cysteine-rich protein 1 n=1 Tax=Lates calcarifer TaxID=8187 RepID=A0A4W6C183_LATCA